MKKMTVSLIVLIFALCTVLAGCSTKDAVNTAAPSTKPAESTEPATSATPAVEQSAKPEELSGDITVWTWAPEILQPVVYSHLQKQ